MSKKNILGLMLFGCIITLSLFIAVDLMIGNETKTNTNPEQKLTELAQDNQSEITSEDTKEEDAKVKKSSFNLIDIKNEEPWLIANPSEEAISAKLAEASKALVASSMKEPELQLIINCEEVDYEAYIPEMKMDSKIENALNIANPQIEVDASSAILFDAITGEVLYYKDAVEPVFPASTVKLLTALVALDWGEEEEEITVGEEVTMIASDSTRAYLKAGQVLTLRSLLEGMLVPSGNDAAYAVAGFVGRKSLKDPGASKEAAVKEFTRLMNQKASELGAKNSCFKTPDGYDAIGQYTTAYDMGMIGLEAVKSETILSVCKKSSARNIFISGEDVTWDTTNGLISRWSNHYYSYAIGLKTGTSTMAGRCLISAGRKDGKEVVSVVMNSSSTGRWSDAITLLKYGLE